MKKEQQQFSLEKYGDLLRSQSITDKSPGSILSDFQAILNFVQEQEIAVSGVHQLLQLKYLPDLNQRLSSPMDIRLQRAAHKSYSYIHGLYLLLRALGIVQIMPQGKNQVLTIDQNILQAWNQLNFTEQYFTLLETWLLVADEAVIGEHSGALNHPLYKVMLFWTRSADIIKFPSYRDQQNAQRMPGFHNIALLELFGLVSIQSVASETGQGWRIQKIKKLPLGDALVNLAIKITQDSFDDWVDESSDKNGFGMLQPALQPFFPEWQTVWTLPGQEFQAGIYTFKVSIGKVWRRIAISAEMDLDELAMAILGSYEFDADHLYLFSYKNQMGVERRIYHDYCEESSVTSETRVGELPLLPGQAMIFLFDFGASWKFKVELESVVAEETKLDEPVVLESKGKSPEQYPEFDEDW
jgi:Plasmid pRiA4b ORF-3-like protein